MLDQRLRLLLETIRRLIRREAKANLSNMLRKIHPADIAHLIKYLSLAEGKWMFNLIDNSYMAATVLREVEQETRTSLLENLDEVRISQILQEMPADDAADMVGGMAEEKAEKVLRLMQQKESQEVEELLSYEEDTAGRIMIPHYFALHEDTTAREAIERLQGAAEAEMVFYIYVVDSRQHLVGIVSLRKLIIVPGSTPLKNIMVTDVISVHTQTDQEEVAQIVAKYNLLAIPVVDDQNKLMGIITVDDVIDIIREEATEDIYKMAGTSEEELLERSAWRIASIRMPWLLITLVGGFVSGVTLKYYNNTLRDVISVVFFIPLVMALGGNVGNQSQTIVVRGLATGRIEPLAVWKILFRQARVGLIMGLVAGVLVGLGATFFQQTQGLGLIVGIAVFVSITISATVGTITPLLFKKINVDPAVAAGPFITNFNDIIGILIYMGISTAMMHYLV
jgi:magnesium transporter